MKAYSYNRENMEYAGTVFCQIDPVRSKLEGHEVFLFPSDATFTAPPSFNPATQKAIYDFITDSWAVKDIQPEPEPQAPPEYTETQLLGQQLTDLELRFMDYISTHE